MHVRVCVVYVSACVCVRVRVCVCVCAYVCCDGVHVCMCRPTRVLKYTIACEGLSVCHNAVTVSVWKCMILQCVC